MWMSVLQSDPKKIRKSQSPLRKLTCRITCWKVNKSQECQTEMGLPAPGLSAYRLPFVSVVGFLTIMRRR